MSILSDRITPAMKENLIRNTLHCLAAMGYPTIVARDFIEQKGIFDNWTCYGYYNWQLPIDEIITMMEEELYNG